MKKLNQQMNYQFDRLGERITYSFEAEEMDTELREFQNVTFKSYTRLTNQKYLVHYRPIKCFVSKSQVFH